jgi:hypothetical protein
MQFSEIISLPEPSARSAQSAKLPGSVQVANRGIPILNSGGFRDDTGHANRNCDFEKRLTAMRFWMEPRLLTGFAVAMCLPFNGCAVVDVPNAHPHLLQPSSSCQSCQSPASSQYKYESVQAEDFQGADVFQRQQNATGSLNSPSADSFVEPEGFGPEHCLCGVLRRPVLAIPVIPLPPMPAFLAEWRAKQQLPEAAPYPRFHPLPVRPMFAPGPAPVPIAAPLSPIAEPTVYGTIP